MKEASRMSATKDQIAKFAFATEHKQLFAACRKRTNRNTIFGRFFVWRRFFFLHIVLFLLIFGFFLQIIATKTNINNIIIVIIIVVIIVIIMIVVIIVIIIVVIVVIFVLVVNDGTNTINIINVFFVEIDIDVSISSAV